MNHSFIDTEVQKYSLRIGFGFAGREMWGAYMSSIAGDCFQIWIEPITDEVIGVHANYVDGPKDRNPEPEQVWTVEINNLRNTLDLAYGQVVDWMQPSTRYFP